MEKFYDRKITQIGEYLQESYEDKFIILFDNNSPEEYRDYCLLHEGSELKNGVSIGDIISFGQNRYEITAVGDVVSKNLGEIGHITLKFDGSREANQPGMLHLEDKEMPLLNIGDSISLHRPLK